ncbi:MAG: beta-ketoacyl-ACP synthase III [Chitinivibrionales bacterium]|nr:beta-ketoacyl-ACP synthase III [Chitinivibrionales bacterium]
MQLRKARILSVGTFVPDNIVTNDDLTKQVDTSDEWIRARTGIQQRRIVSPEAPLTNYELGARAARTALDRAGVVPGDIDCIICATFTPDCFFPSTACRMQHVLGCTNASAFDISAACSGFVYGLTIADSMIRSGQVRTVLLVGAELISRTIDWTDRGTCILFGDGAGAVVIRAEEDGDRGVLATRLASDGSKGDILYLPAFGDDRFMKMKGNEVFKHAVRLMGDIAVEACNRAGVRLEEVDALIPHQANIRIINGLAERLGIPMQKVITNIERYGNTSSASIPLALDEGWSSGRIGEGSLVVFTALGGGVTMGGAVVRL